MHARTWHRLAAIALAVIAAVLVVAFAPTAASPPEAAPKAPTTTTTPPMPAEKYPLNAVVYDLDALPVIDVFTITSALEVDDAPDAAPLEMLATPHAPGAPLFADPLRDPVGMLPSELRFDGETVPVIEAHTFWVKVLIAGRAGLPSDGVTGQLTAWMRAADVELEPNSMSVDVDLGDPSIRILDDGEVVYETSKFGFGSSRTPTPPGRTFIMTIRTDPNAGYTRGHPIAYLGVQSSTLDGFDGHDNAVTAFHYHDARSGSISNGCLRVDVKTTERLAELPLGTPVTVHD